MTRFFKLKENNTSVSTEITAGLTTFFAMSYILFVAPNILGKTGMPTQGIFLATIIASVVSTLIMALFANVHMFKLLGWDWQRSLRIPLFYNLDLVGRKPWHWSFFAG